jgi:hypothetical protein
MASLRNPVNLSEMLQAVLDIRSSASCKCPADVESKLATIPFFRVAAARAVVANTHSGIPRLPATSGSVSNNHGRFQHPPQRSNGTNNRFSNLEHVSPPDGWRGAAVQQQQQQHDEGFEVWTNRRRRGAISHPHAAASAATTASAAATTTTAVTEPSSDTPVWKSNRYVPVETKIHTDSMEDRIMGKIRSKINKIGESTYVATRAFMQQILDSGETDFLGEFMCVVFKKAANETSFCSIYARLLHDLADEFGHLRTEMQRRFREYTRIFAEAKQSPDVGTADYAAFLEAQAEKKFRRGYSQFVAELAKLGEVTSEDFRLLVEQIVQSIRDSYTDEENKLLCEELVDCLATMSSACGKSILAKAAWMNPCLVHLAEISNSPRSASPGLTNKARFGLMNLLDAAKKGW